MRINIVLKLIHIYIYINLYIYVYNYIYIYILMKSVYRLTIYYVCHTSMEDP